MIRFIGGALATVMACALAFGAYSILSTPGQPETPLATAAQPEQAVPKPAAEQPVALTRHNVQTPALAVDTPSSWISIPKDRLHEFDSLGMLGASGMEDSVLLTLANANTDPEINGIVMFIDAGPQRGSSLAFMRNLEEIMVESLASTPLKAAQIALKTKAERVSINGLDGAKVGFSGRTDYGPISMEVILLEVDGRAVMVNTVSMDGTAEVGLVEQVLASVRPG